MGLPVDLPWFGPLGRFHLNVPPAALLALVAWTLAWKGVALWRAARAGQSAWFIALLLINTLGLLEIVFLHFYAGRPGPLPLHPSTPGAPAFTAVPAAAPPATRAAEDASGRTESDARS
jgi:methionyl-tRNA synthetase